MSQDLTKVPVMQVPNDIANQFSAASKFALCSVDDTDTVGVSSLGFIKHLASDPDSVAGAGLVALDAVAVAAGATAAASILGASWIGGPVGFLAAVGGLAMGLQNNRIASVVIINRCKGKLTQTEVYQARGVQTASPVISDVDTTTGRVLSPDIDNVIPGFVPMGDLETFGVGFYRFEKNLDLGVGTEGTSGAISWTCDDPKVKNQFAFAWSVPQFGDPVFDVTVDLSQYASLQDFHDKCLKADRKNTGDFDNDKSSRVRMFVQPQIADYPDTSDEDHIVFTVSMQSF